jgi:peroxin-4
VYAGGVWLMYLEIPEGFPQEPPTMRFVTPIRHANVNAYGRICHSILERSWTCETKISTVLSCVYGLLLVRALAWVQSLVSHG